MPARSPWPRPCWPPSPSCPRSCRCSGGTCRYGPGYNGPLVTAVQVHPPAHPSQAYEDKYNQAKANQKRQLRQRRAEIARQRVALQAAIRADLRAQAALTARVAGDRVRVRLLERVALRACRVAPPSRACQRAKAALAAAQASLAAAT